MLSPALDWEQLLTTGRQTARPDFRSAAGLGKIRTQLPQVGGIDVGNGVELQPPLLPTHHVVTIPPRRSGPRVQRPGGPHKHVDDVLASPIDDSRNDPA